MTVPWVVFNSEISLHTIAKLLLTIFMYQYITWIPHTMVAPFKYNMKSTPTESRDHVYLNDVLIKYRTVSA